MSELAAEQVITHSGSHRQDAADKGGRDGYPTDRHTTLKKYYVATA